MSYSNFDQIRRAVLRKRAAEVLTPEAEQAAMAPDPSMAGAGAPMPGGAPADPSMMGGAPMPGGAPAPGGMPVPPEILQDQNFIQFCAEMLGAQLDPNSGQFIDMQQGVPIPAEVIVQVYQQFQQQLAAQGGMPGAGAGAAGPMPEAGGAMDGAQPDPAADMEAQKAELMKSIQSGLDASIQAYTEQLNKKLEGMLDRIEALTQAVESLRDSRDSRDRREQEEQRRIQDDLAADLNAELPVKQATETQSSGAVSGTRPVQVFDLLMRG